jgi:hypothetical protein
MSYPLFRLAERNRLYIAMVAGATAAFVGLNSNRIVRESSKYYDAISHAVQDTRKGKVRSIEGKSISDTDAISLSERYVAAEYKKEGLKPSEIVQSHVARPGDSDWSNLAGCALNDTDEYPAAGSVDPNGVTAVYHVLKSGAGLCVAIDSRTGRFISMEGDN